MSEWKEYKLGDAPLWIIDGDRGKNYPSQNEFQNCGYCLFLSTKNVRPYGFDFSDCQFISYEKDQLLRKGKLNRYDLVLTTRGTVGNVGYYSDNVQYENIRINSGMVIIRPKIEFLFPKFNFYIFRHLQKDFATFTTGSAQPQLPIRDLNEIEILLPPLSEQKSIASILSSLDDKIDLLHRQNATLEKMAETLFRQWFVEEAKEEWEEVELEKLIDVVIDNRGKTPPTVDFPTDYPLIEVNALNSNSCLVDYSVIRKYVNKETYDNWFRKHLKVNDIIISTVGTIGVFSIHLVDKGCIAQNLVGLRSNSISSYFIYNFFKTNVETLINLDIGGVQPSIKVPHLLGLIIKYPPYELLRKYDESVEIYFNKIAKNQTQIGTLTALRDTLLPKLMSGEVTTN